MSGVRTTLAVKVFAIGAFLLALDGQLNMSKAACSWSTIFPGTTADATQVMSNFDCLAFSSSPSLFGAVSVAPSSFFNPSSLKIQRGSMGTLASDQAGVTYQHNGGLSGLNEAWVFDTGTNGNDYRFKTGGTDRMVINGTTGNVGIGTTTPGGQLTVAGTIRQSGCTTAGTLSTNASGDIICTSDARLKNIRGGYTGGLEAISRITPQRFSFKPSKNNPSETFVHAGFIAQDVKSAIPEAVALQKNGFYSLDTTAILATSVNAIKELRTENQRQANEIAQLRQKNADVVARLKQQAQKTNQRFIALEQMVRVRTAGMAFKSSLDRE